MTDQHLHTQLCLLFKESAQAHHAAFSVTDGEDPEWPDFYATEFIEHYAPSETATEDKLALYTLEGCPFCRRVNEVIARLGLDIELRDVGDHRELREELIEARGRATVPVLWIQSPDGEVHWMPESRDIIHYLEHMYG